MTQEQLSIKLKVTPITIKRNTNKLREKGLLERIGSDKNGYWKINLQQNKVRNKIHNIVKNNYKNYKIEESFYKKLLNSFKEMLIIKLASFLLYEDYK